MSNPKYVINHQKINSMRKRDPFIGTDTGYLRLELAGAPHLLTHKRYVSIIAKALNAAIRKRQIKVGEYDIMPGVLELLVQRVEMPLQLWRDAFVSNLSCAIYARLEREVRGHPVEWLKHYVDERGVISPPLLWSRQVYQPILSSEMYEEKQLRMWSLPVREGLVTDMAYYPYNSINNRAGIQPLGINW